MNICVLYYDGFCEFEVVFAVNGFRDNMISVALENRVYVSEEKQKFLPDKVLSEVNPDDIDLLIIPGGDPRVLYDNPELKEFLCKLNEKNKYIAGICGGAEIMAYYGLLDNKRANGDSAGFIIDESNRHIYEKVMVTREDVVRDGNCITSIGKAYIEFAVELGKLMNVYKNEEEINEDYRWLKNIK